MAMKLHVFLSKFHTSIRTNAMQLSLRIHNSFMNLLELKEKSLAMYVFVLVNAEIPYKFVKFLHCWLLLLNLQSSKLTNSNVL